MPCPSTFGLGTRPVFIQVDDDETITLYPHGGSLFYGDKDVSSTNGTEVTPGSSVTLQADAWIVAVAFIGVTAVRMVRQAASGSVAPAAPVTEADNLGVWGATATVTLTDAPKIHSATLTANTLTALTIDGLAANREAVLQILQPSVTGGGTLTINGQAAAVAGATDALTMIFVYCDADATEVRFVVTNSDLSAQVVKTNGTPMAGRGGISFGQGFTLTDDSTNDQTVVELGTVTAGSLDATSLVPIDATGYPGDAALTFGGTGLYSARTRIKHPTPTVIARLHTPASLNPANPSSVTADTSPDHPSGACTVSAVGFNVRTMGQTFAAPVDISNKIVVAPCKLTTTDKTKMYRVRLEVTSAVGGTDFTNRKSVTIQPQNANYLLYDVYQNFAFGPQEWFDTGTGANLTAVTGIRFYLENNGSTVTTTISASHIGTLPITGNANGKASLVLCFDDWNTSHWTTVLPLFESYGFPATLVPNVAQASDTEVRNMIWHMQSRYGWQVCSHAYTNAEHVDSAGDALRQHHAKLRQRHLALGLSGGEDWAWYGGQLSQQDRVDILQTYYRTGRLFISNPTRTETLPPMEPMRLMCWGEGSADQTDDGAAMIAYIDKAIAQKGLAVITWHNSLAGGDIEAVLAHADANRATLDVQTMEDALRPWIVER